MAATRIQTMDITDSTSELSDRWRAWLRGFSHFAERKANLQNAGRKKSEFLYRVASGVLDTVKNLTIMPAPEGEYDNVNQGVFRKLNACKNMPRTKVVFFARYAKNRNKASTDSYSDFVDKQDIVVMVPKNMNLT